jgi:hypothetical protein
MPVPHPIHVTIIPSGLPYMLSFRFPHHQHLYNTPFLPAAAAVLGCLTLKMKTSDPSKCRKLHTQWRNKMFQQKWIFMKQVCIGLWIRHAVGLVLLPYLCCWSQMCDKFFIKLISSIKSGQCSSLSAGDTTICSVREFKQTVPAIANELMWVMMPNCRYKWTKLPLVGNMNSKCIFKVVEHKRFLFCNAVLTHNFL